VSILYRFRDIAGYLLKVADFDTPHLHLAPLQGVTRIEFCGDLCRQKTRVPGVVRVIVHLAILVEHRLVTDGQTDTGPWLVLQMHSFSRWKWAIKLITTTFIISELSRMANKPLLQWHYSPSQITHGHHVTCVHSNQQYKLNSFCDRCHRCYINILCLECHHHKWIWLT